MGKRIDATLFIDVKENGSKVPNGKKEFTGSVKLGKSFSKDLSSLKQSIKVLGKDLIKN